jgi:ATP-dependent DNA helicase RecG
MQSDLQLKIVNYIKEHPTASMREISDSLGDISPNGIKYHLRKLKELGVIRRIGPDRGGSWDVLN